MAVGPRGGLVRVDEVEETRVLSALYGNDADADPSESSDDYDALKEALTAEAQRSFGSPEFVVSDLKFPRGSLEVLVVLSAASAVVKDFGSVAQGLREMARLGPAPIRSFVEQRSRRALGRNVSMDVHGAPTLEMRTGLLVAEAVPTRRTTRDASVSPDIAGGPGGRDPQPPYFRYLITSNVLLTAVVALIAIFLLVRR